MGRVELGAETAAMAVSERKGMALTAAKVAVMATMDCSGSRNSSTGRKSHDSGSACTDRSNDRYTVDTSRVAAAIVAAMAAAMAQQ